MRTGIYYCMTVVFVALSTGQYVGFAQQLKIGIIGAAITCGAGGCCNRSIDAAAWSGSLAAS